VLQQTQFSIHLKLRPLSQLIVLVATLQAAGPAFSGQFEDGLAARDRGDYAVAFGWQRLVMPIASSSSACSTLQEEA